MAVAVSKMNQSTPVGDLLRKRKESGGPPHSQWPVNIPARLELESHLIGSILPDMVNLPLDNESGWFLICEESHMEEVTVKIPQDLQQTASMEPHT